MTTINDVADALALSLASLTDLRAYSEARELPHDPAAEVVFESRVHNTAARCQAASFVVEVSVSTDDRGWDKAIRLLRLYLEPKGTRSVEAAIETDPTLGGKVDFARVTGASGEKRIRWGDGYRVGGRVEVLVQYSP